MKNNRYFIDALFEEFDYFDDEVDNILTEDLDTMLKYYNNLQNWDKQELLKFLTKDPTWNNDKEQGQYSKWILDKLNRKLLDNSHLGHLNDVLKRFEDNKKNLKNKDINKFKSIQEIDAYLNDDNSYNELSHSQIVRQHRRDKQKADLNNEAALIYEDSDWEIWIPKTYAASCKLGKGSKWCTASTETSEYFDDYSSDGDLYIILNKYNEKEKYQFHIESESYMDINDEKIDLLDLCEREDTRNWMNALRQYNADFNKQCKHLIDKVKKAREEFNSFSQKINSIKIIKYPTQKDIIDKFGDFRDYIDIDKYLRKEIDKINIKLEIESSVEVLGPLTFKYANWIKQVSFEKNSRLKRIGEFTFERCTNLTSITIPEGVTSIGDYAFEGCSNLKSITIPSSVRSIGYHAFHWCGLKEVYIKDLAKWCEIEFESSYSNPLNHAHNLYLNDELVTELIIPNSVTSIGRYAFYGCINLKSITIPESVTSIGFGAFDGCSNLLIKTSNQYVIDYCIKNKIKYEKID